MSPNESQGENMLMPKGQPCQKTSKVVEASVRRQKEVMYLHLEYEYESVVLLSVEAKERFVFNFGHHQIQGDWLSQNTPQVSSLLNRESLYPGKEEHMAGACEQLCFPKHLLIAKY